MTDLESKDKPLESKEDFSPDFGLRHPAVATVNHPNPTQKREETRMEHKLSTLPDISLPTAGFLEGMPEESLPEPKFEEEDKTTHSQPEKDEEPSNEAMPTEEIQLDLNSESAELIEDSTDIKIEIDSSEDSVVSSPVTSDLTADEQQEENRDTARVDPPIEEEKELDTIEKDLETLFKDEEPLLDKIDSPSDEKREVAEGEYDPPTISYNFGIPGISPSSDPSIRQLSLETLDKRSKPFTVGESSFVLSADDEDTDDSDSGDENKGIKQNSGDTSLKSSAVLTKKELVEGLETFMELCEVASNASSPVDFLVLSGYFMSNLKHIDKYSLKDLNSQLLRSGLTPVNHGTLETAISSGYVKLVPDLTGTAHVGEYLLTEEGQAYVESLINL